MLARKDKGPKENSQVAPLKTENSVGFKSILRRKSKKCVQFLLDGDGFMLELHKS